MKKQLSQLSADIAFLSSDIQKLNNLRDEKVQEFAKVFAEYQKQCSVTAPGPVPDADTDVVADA